MDSRYSEPLLEANNSVYFMPAHKFIDERFCDSK
jgi:hypothetical protein